MNFLNQWFEISKQYLANLLKDGLKTWDQFWFTPRDPYWLGILRILAGLMLLYTHAVWTIDFDGFLGPERRTSDHFLTLMNPTDWAWSHFHWSSDPLFLWTMHFAALAAMLAFTLGFLMPWTGWIATFFAISYAHRASGTLFGLDQINVALVFCLSLGRSGKRWSIDRLWLLRKQKAKNPDPAGAGQGEENTPVFCIWSNIGTRLIQIQLCVIYLFAGFGKLQGETWWNGEALWGAVSSYQYQSIDLTWLSDYPMLINFLTHLTIVWEVSYLFLVWPKWSRPLVICTAIAIHAGIALFLGMMTFGTIMIVANLAFLEWRAMFPDSKSK